MNHLSGRQQVTSPSSIVASCLSEHFGAVMSDSSRPVHIDTPAGPSIPESLDNFRPANIEEVHKLLHVRGLNPRKAMGSDQIPAAILKSGALVQAPSLAILANASLTSGIVPSALEHADVRPLFKSGDPDVPKMKESEDELELKRFHIQKKCTVSDSLQPVQPLHARLAFEA